MFNGVFRCETLNGTRCLRYLQGWVEGCSVYAWTRCPLIWGEQLLSIAGIYRSWLFASLVRNVSSSP